MAELDRTVLGGTDGFRAEYTEQHGPAKMNRETVAGLAAATMLQPEVIDKAGPVVVLRDTRPSSPELAAAVIDGIRLTDAAEIINLGVTPTPTGQKVAQHVDARATFAVTASHNPAHQNGLKYMLGHAKPDSRQVEAISDSYYQNYLNPVLGQATENSATERREELTQWYHDEVVSAITAQYGSGVLDGTVLAYDGAFGAAKELMPRILQSLGATVYRFACGEGVINASCGAADLMESKAKSSGLERFLRSHRRLTRNPKFIGALANDGDGDRVLGMAVRGTENRQYDVLNGNHFMWALAQGEQKRGGIVGTLYTNGGLRTALQAAGICFEECDNGDRYVTEALRAKQVAGMTVRRGGEFTGHLIDTDWLGSGDGLYMGAWYTADTVSRGMTFADRLDELQLYPERLRNFSVSSLARAKRFLASDTYKQHAQLILSDIAAAGGRAVVRISGTEAKVRVWVESPQAKHLDYAAQTLENYIKRQVELA